MVCLWPFVRRSTDSFKPGDRFNCTSGPANLSFTLRVAICTGGKIFEILIERNLYLHFLNARGIHIYIYIHRIDVKCNFDTVENKFFSFSKLDRPR